MSFSNPIKADALKELRERLSRVRPERLAAYFENGVTPESMCTFCSMPMFHVTRAAPGDRYGDLVIPWEEVAPVFESVLAENRAGREGVE